VFPDLAVLSDDNLEAVKKNIETLKKIIQEMDDADWEREEERRKAK